MVGEADIAALRTMVAQLAAAVGAVAAPAETVVSGRRMGRKRAGTTRWRHGRYQARLRLADGTQSPEFDVPRPVDGTDYDETYARSVTLAWQRRYDATGRLPDETDGITAAPVAAPTAHAWAAEWIKGQTHRTQADEAAYLELHLKPAALGALPLDRVTQADVVAWVKWLRARKSQRDARPLAPRYVRSIYDVARRAFEHAVIERKIPGSPFAGTSKFLPAVEDKDAGARATWKLARAEAAALLTDARVPPDRRVLYALALYTGARFGELSALRWSAYDKEAPVLGRLTFATAFNRRTKRVEGTKTRATKLVPVHPALAATLAAWWTSGWAEHQGRAPKRGDLVVPSKLGKERGVYGAGEMLARDLTALGLDTRHFHALRHTFVSLAIDAGARGEVLKRATHAPPKGAFDMYAAVDWPTLCAEVAKLDLSQPAPPMRTDSGTVAEEEANGRMKDRVERRPQPDSNQWPLRNLARTRVRRFALRPRTVHKWRIGTDSGTAWAGSPGERFAACEGALWAWHDAALAAEFAETGGAS